MISRQMDKRVKRVLCRGKSWNSVLIATVTKRPVCDLKGLMNLSWELLSIALTHAHTHISNHAMNTIICSYFSIITHAHMSSHAMNTIYLFLFQYYHGAPTIQCSESFCKRQVISLCENQRGFGKRHTLRRDWKIEEYQQYCIEAIWQNI